MKIGSVVNRFRKTILKIGSARKGSVKLIITSIIGSLIKFCCYKSKKLSNLLLTFLFVFGFIINIYEAYKFVSSNFLDLYFFLLLMFSFCFEVSTCPNKPLPLISFE